MTPEDLEPMLQRLDPAVRQIIEQQLESLDGTKLEMLLPQLKALAKESLGALTDESAPSFSGAPTGDKYLTYRGDITGIVGVGGAVAFVTRHAEGQPTALYRLDAGSLKLSDQALPCGGVAVAADPNTVYVGGTDRRVYAAAGTADPKPLGDVFPADIRALLPVAGDRLAVLNGTRLDLISCNTGSVLQTLELPEVGTCIAADPTGQWLAVGTEKGTVAVFDGEGKDTFEPAEADRLHDGAVTALAFEPDELRFFSAGADHKLLSTHARGRLEPEDKGRDNNHTDVVTGLLLSPVGDRLISGGRDAALKTWPRAGGVKPAKFDQGVGKVVALTLVTAGEEHRLAVVGQDNTIRFFRLTDDGRFGDPLATAHGAVDRAKNELKQSDAKRREKVLKELAGWDDTVGIDLIANRLGKDNDHQIRLLAVELLTASANRRSVTPLTKAISHADAKVRVAAFHGLHKRLGANDVAPTAALKSGKADVGILAVKALGSLASEDDEAMTRLTAALDHDQWDVRKAVLDAFVSVFAADPPRAGLVALGSKHADVRAAALSRFYERKVLADPRVQSAVRRRLEDDDATVRRVAFLVSVLARYGLANYLRKADPELHRQLNELQGTDSAIEKVPASDRAKLDADDLDVPLQATAARSLDTCLRGARALAVLGDPRAFGLLLQLSREDSTTARVEVCRALAALGDVRSVARLRSLLFDSEPSVRDAAYSALARIQSTDPLSAATSGLTAAAEDVRKRGLQTLVEFARQETAGLTDTSRELLLRALNDSASGVRGEAWKAALGLKVGGGGEGTLRFARQSVHADVRKEVLTEVLAQPGEAWATPLLHEFFDDPDPGLRADAFAQATRKSKDLVPLETALGSHHADVRRLAIDGLEKKRTKAAQTLLVKALGDPDHANRQHALAALVDADARGALADALENSHPDVRVRAATALARHGDAVALRPLLDLATAAEPTEKEKIAPWLETAEAALNGLAELGEPAAVAPIRWLLGSSHARLRKAAASALVGCSRLDSADGLRQALPHSDPEVRHRAALGLAYLGDASVLPQLLSEPLANTVGAGSVLAAAVALGAAGDRLLAVFLDHADDALRNRAVQVELLLELRGDGSAERCLECLSASGPRLRLIGAQALERYADSAEFRDFVAATLNDRGDDQAWKVPAEVVDTLADLLSAGPPQLRAQTVGLLHWFAEKDQSGWNQAWAVFAGRHAAAIDTAKAKAGPRPKSALTVDDLRELAFGAYVGLVREQGSAAASPLIVRVRQTALTRIFTVASAEAAYNRAARPVLIQALGDPNQPVRLQAFDHLLALGTDPARLGDEALETGHTDLGVKGLELLSRSAGGESGDGNAVLERAMLGRTDDIATEAAKLLAGRLGLVPVATSALAAAHVPLRKLAVQWLVEEYDQSAEARQALRSALQSPFVKLREDVALQLAGKKDEAAFDVLVELLRRSDNAKRQDQAAQALLTLGDPRGVAAILDRVENDTTGTADAKTLIHVASLFRRAYSVDRFFDLVDRNKDWWPFVFKAVLFVSGFDQKIEDPDDEWSDRSWEQKQHPRDPAVFARLLDAAITTGSKAEVTQLLPAARWCRGASVDTPLSQLVGHPDADLRNAVVQVLGWRLKHRGTPAEPLLSALRHKDPTTQFFAAEGLAQAGRGEGINVLLSAIEYLDDVDLRERAVLALGELGDARAVDVLVRLAGDDGHALQEPAAEAIGHLRGSPEGVKIGQLLERLAKGQGEVADRAIVGLRWFDTASGWELIRRRAADKSAMYARETPITQLGYKDDPANRTLLTNILSSEEFIDLIGAAFVAARRLWGRESLEPYYAIVQNGSDELEGELERPNPYYFGGEAPLTVVCQRGEPLRIMDIFPRCPAGVQQQLEASLLGRPDVPTKEAAAALSSPDEGTVRLAARLLGRVGNTDAAISAGIENALGNWQKVWQDRRAKVDRDPRQQPSLNRAVDCLRSLTWAAGRLGAALNTMAGLATFRPDDPLARPVRREAVRCLATVDPSADVIAAMEVVARGTDAEAREIAAGVLAQHAPDRAAAALEALVSDRPSFDRLFAGKDVPAADRFAQTAAGLVHYQPVALSHLIASKDVPTLAAVAKDQKQAESARLGAVEALGATALSRPRRN